MKRNLLLIFCIVIANASIGQTLTQANAGMAVGNVLKYYAIDTTSVNHNTSGSGVTWNFPTVPITTTEVSTTCVTPVSTPYYSSFSSANIAGQSVSGQYSYYTCNSTELTMHGIATSTYTMVYSDPQKMFQFPFSYGNTFTDNLACNYTMSSIPFQRTGTVTESADAKGTLIINGHSYNNVLRIKYIQNITDVCSYYTMDQTLISYMWYDCIHNTPVLNLYYSYIDQGGFITESKSAYVADFVNSVDFTFYSDNLNVDVFPNPIQKGNEMDVIISDSDYTNNYNYSITDISGRVVLNGTTEKSSEQTSINTSSLNTGIYFLNISSGNGFITKKFVVE